MKKCLIILFVLIFSVGIAYTKDIEDKEQKAAVGFFFFGLKRFVETIRSPAVKNDEILLRYQELYVEINNKYRFYQTAEVYDLEKNNIFFAAGLRSGDFIMNVSIQDKFGIKNYQPNNLQSSDFRDIIEDDAKVTITVFRITKWYNKSFLMPEEYMIVPIKM